MFAFVSPPRHHILSNSRRIGTSWTIRGWLVGFWWCPDQELDQRDHIWKIPSRQLDQMGQIRYCLLAFKRFQIIFYQYFKLIIYGKKKVLKKTGWPKLTHFEVDFKISSLYCHGHRHHRNHKVANHDYTCEKKRTFWKIINWGKYLLRNYLLNKNLCKNYLPKNYWLKNNSFKIIYWKLFI